MLDSKLINESLDIRTVEIELRDLLEHEDCSNDEVDRLIKITKSVGYSKLLKNNYEENKASFPPEYKAVQDADLLDAIGCVGIGRCFTYGGKKSRPLFGVGELMCQDKMSYDLYTANRSNQPSLASPTRTNSSVEHFFEKLLRIKNMLITPYGRKLGIQRHERMIRFLRDLQDELPESYDMEKYISKFE